MQWPLTSYNDTETFEIVDDPKNMNNFVRCYDRCIVLYHLDSSSILFNFSPPIEFCTG